MELKIALAKNITSSEFEYADVNWGRFYYVWNPL